ncbi:MAG: A/G-specific adenine glycosylase [Parachlamydiaceae bacterium]
MKASVLKANPMPTQLARWFLERKRPLPWRDNPTPYAVWVSEVMLQQTQASVVIPYFHRFMEKFPTVQALAEAPIEEVVKLWEGLGYYSRARNLHQGARMVLDQWGGTVPHGKDELLSIKGLGRYTVGAILSFAFKMKSPAVDGNVARVMSRYFAVQEDICQTKTLNRLNQLTEQFLPDEEPWVVAEALIELGATVCKKTPLCENCPIAEGCQAKKLNLETKLPIKKAAAPVTKLTRVVLAIQISGRYVVKQVEEGQLMAGLYEFPYFEEEMVESVESLIWEKFGYKAAVFRELPTVQHSFTRYRAELQPYLVIITKGKAPNGYQLVTLEEAEALPFSSGHKRILSLLS